MYSLDLPSATSADAYKAAVFTIRNKDRRAPYVAAIPLVQVRCDAFDQLAMSLQFDQASGAAYDVAGLKASAMVDLYDGQFNKRVGTAAIRDGIKNAAPGELCPYCGEGRVTELDHYLPKSLFAGTALHPANLVPVCGGCNRKKLAYSPDPSNPAVLHPYFDTAFNTPWLSAVIAGSSLRMPVVNFKVSLPLFDPQLETRLNAHMNVFALWPRFSAWAAQSLTNFEWLLKTPFGVSMTLTGARKHLQLTALQQSGGRVNSWEGATHEAMLASDWYLTQHLGLK